MKRVLWCALAVGLSCAVPDSCGAGQFVGERETLCRLPGVEVVVERFDTERVRTTGITEDFIRTQVDLRLRGYGISVLSRDESNRSASQPWLYVSFTFLVDDLGGTSYSYEMQMRQTVLLFTNGNTCAATTWNKGGIAKVGVNRLRNNVEDSVRDLVDSFANDWLTANPPRR
jgi:hypothetical protein